MRRSHFKLLSIASSKFYGPFIARKTLREKQDTSLRQILLTRFDFTAMAEKSRGNRWKDLDGMEAQFVSTFTDFVEHSYMSTLGYNRGEKVVYDRDRSDGKSHAGSWRPGNSDQNRIQAPSSRVDSGRSTIR